MCSSNKESNASHEDSAPAANEAERVVCKRACVPTMCRAQRLDQTTAVSSGSWRDEGPTIRKAMMKPCKTTGKLLGTIMKPYKSTIDIYRSTQDHWTSPNEANKKPLANLPKDESETNSLLLRSSWYHPLRSPSRWVVPRLLGSEPGALSCW